MVTATVDLITSKIERKFEVLDADRDGLVGWADYEGLIGRYLKAYQLGKDDRRARALCACYQMYWLELLRHADVNGDRLTKEQFVKANRLASIDTSRLNMVEGSAHAIFDVIDANGDNEIGKNEFARFLKDVWKADGADVIVTFAGLDTDGNGVISRQEFIRAMREYFYSSDQNAAGSLLFGRI